MRLAIAALVLLALAPAAVAGDDSSASASSTVLDRFGLASTTGQSPWLVMASRGAYQYFTTPADQQSRLSITAHPLFFGPLSVLLLLVAIKDSLLTFLGPLKTPLDVLGELFHVAGGAAGVAYLGDVAFNSPEVTQQVADVPQTTSWLLPTLTWLMASIVHLAVWVVFNTIEVAIILNPFPFVDTALKSGRTTLVGILSGASAIHPILGFLLALPLFLCCVFVMPVALRMTRLGCVFCLDTLAGWFGLSGSLPQQTMAFIWGRVPGVPLLAYGVVSRTAEGGLVYTVRRMGFLWRRAVPLPADCYVGIGTLTPMLLSDECGSATDLLLFPPRYNGKEPALAQQLGIGRVENVSLGASLRAFWRRLWGRRTQPQTT